MRCKTSKCPEVVTYEPKPVNGITSRTWTPPDGRRKIYLTCDAGHTHLYVVWPALAMTQR